MKINIIIRVCLCMNNENLSFSSCHYSCISRKLWATIYFIWQHLHWNAGWNKMCFRLLKSQGAFSPFCVQIPKATGIQHPQCRGPLEWGCWTDIYLAVQETFASSYLYFFLLVYINIMSRCTQASAVCLYGGNGTQTKVLAAFPLGVGWRKNK